jgi:hypothetical protein
MGRRPHSRGIRHGLVGLAGAALVLVGAACAPRPAVAAAPDAAQRQFAANLVAALQTQDAARLAGLYHPAMRACETPATKAYFDFGRREDLLSGAALTGAFTIESVQPVIPRGAAAGKAAPLGLLPADGFSYPVPPTHQIQINAQMKDRETLYMVRTIARDGAAWRLVDPCPNAKGMAFFDDQRAKGAAQRQAGLQRVAAMAAPLREEMQRLVADGRWMQAVDRYRAATGADLQTAADVVSAMQRP